MIVPTCFTGIVLYSKEGKEDEAYIFTLVNKTIELELDYPDHIVKYLSISLLSSSVTLSAREFLSWVHLFFWLVVFFFFLIKLKVYF